MPKSKRKVLSHLIESKSLDIIKRKLPEYWTIREYKPDYGLDLSIEVFEAIQDDTYETLGEHFFVQVKGTEHLKIGTRTIYSEYLLEKKTLFTEDSKKYKEIEVVKFSIETSELFTIERMSASIPVMLFVVDIISEEIYYICLNDYIDKVIIPYEPNYLDKATKTIDIPTSNRINEIGVKSLLFYSKRPKLYSFFINAEYQRNELEFINDEKLCEIYPYFVDKLLRYDIWSLKDLWPLMKMYHSKLVKLKNENILPEIEQIISSREVNMIDKEWTTAYSNNEFTEYESLFNMSLRTFWSGLASISHTYEEDCREWHLPTYYCYITSE